MKGNLPQKVVRLVTNLARNPAHVSRYVTHNIFNGRTPLDLEVPWFSYAAIDFLADYLTQELTVCEYGSGGSTLFFARRVESVFTIEDNAHWFELVQQRLRDHSLGNVTMKLVPFNFRDPVGFASSDYLHAIPDRQFDVIVVDGSEEWTQIRPICFEHAEGFVKPGGIIILDDSWRYPGLRSSHHAKRFETFQSAGPCRPGVTSTDVFFY